MNMSLSHEQIAARAFEFYASGGHMDGNAEGDWLRAESLLRAETGCGSPNGYVSGHVHQSPRTYDTLRWLHA